MDPDLTACECRRFADAGFGFTSLLGDVVKSYMSSFQSRWVSSQLKKCGDGGVFREPHCYGLSALEGQTSSQADLTITRDALLLVAAEEMPEVGIGRELGGVGGVDWQDLWLMARSSRLRLINREIERSDIGKTPFTAAAI